VVGSVVREELSVLRECRSLLCDVWLREHDGTRHGCRLGTGRETERGRGRHLIVSAKQVGKSELPRRSLSPVASSGDTDVMIRTRYPSRLFRRHR